MAFPKKDALNGAKEKKRKLEPDSIGQALSEPGENMDRARHLWARYEALPSYNLPDDVAEHAGEAITARAVFDAKKVTCCDDKGRSMLSVPKMRDAMKALAACEGWQGIDTVDRSLLATLLQAADVWLDLRKATIGSLRHDGTWQQPPPPEDDDNEPKTLADITDEPVVTVAAGLLFAGQIGLMHGPAFGGKSTLLANVIARITTGRPWLEKDTVSGDVVIVAEDTRTYRRIMADAQGNLARVHVRRWPKLAPSVADIEPVAVVVDTMAFIGGQLGGLDLNQAGETDRILRPLERLAREHGCAVLVTDHEPHAETGTRTKDWPRGSTAKSATPDYVLRCTRDGETTTVEPNRGAARLGIETFTFAVDGRGRRTVDRPADLPPAITGAAGEPAAAGDDQPLADSFAKWRDREPAIRAMLTTDPTASDHAIVKATKLPKGESWKKPTGAKAFIASIRTAMLTESVDGSPDSEPTPPRTAEPRGSVSRFG